MLAYHLHYHREFGDWERVEVSVVVVVLVFGDFINSDTQSQLCTGNFISWRTGLG